MKKILNILIVMLILFTTTYSAKETFYEAEYIPNIFIRKDGSTHFYEQAKALRRQSDQKLVYCIEPWEYINNNVVYEKGININTLSNNTLDRLSLIAYYGYNYKDQTSMKWYYITQIAMWREIDPSSNFYFTDTLNGTYTDKYENDIKHLMNLVNNHNKKPEFGNDEFYNQNYKDLTLTDKNNVLSNYKIETNLEYTVNKNNITFKTKGNNSQRVKFIKKDTKYDAPPILYKSNNSQNLLLTGSFKNIEKNIDIYSKDVETIIKKVDEDHDDIDFTGTKFLLTNDNGFEKELILESNELTLLNLVPGIYYLKELITIEGYKILDEPLQFEIFENTSSTIEVTNFKIKKQVIINKRYEVNNELLFEPNIYFEIKGDNYYKKIKTDEYGFIDLLLPYGTYVVSQVTTTPGYDKVEDFTIVVDNEELEEFYLINKSLTTKIKVIKTNSNGDPILNNKAHFKLTNKYTNEVFYMSTNNKGELIFDDIKMGTYLLEEINAPKGYVISKEIHEIIIDSNNINEEIEIKFVNEEIIKVPETSKDEINLEIMFYEDKKKKK